MKAPCGSWICSVSHTRLPLAIDFAGDVARFELAMELTRWVGESLPMRGEQVHFSAHQFASTQVSYGAQETSMIFPWASCAATQLRRSTAETGDLACGTWTRLRAPVTEIGTDLAKTTCRFCRAELGLGNDADAYRRLEALPVPSLDGRQQVGVATSTWSYGGRRTAPTAAAFPAGHPRRPNSHCRPAPVCLSKRWAPRTHCGRSGCRVLTDCPMMLDMFAPLIVAGPGLEGTCG